MQLILRTEVNGNYKDVIKEFDRELFLALAPKVAKIELKEFTGSETGDLVHIQFLRPIRTEWTSDIIDHGENKKRAYFVDKGRVLPFPLKFWEHHHIVEKIDDSRSYIIDDIRFKGPNAVITALLRPFIYLGFSPRKSIYKKYFAERFTALES